MNLIYLSEAEETLTHEEIRKITMKITINADLLIYREPPAEILAPTQEIKRQLSYTC
ncbi:protein of unknown function [Mesotoga infera]|uniref:Uncharacterized protein n=1 Tax=Mesotoga infera TaxID=1236046 RepID=A0A7Z7LDF6_9BACT|nr:protein of unknown function [Mesotoga infera]